MASATLVETQRQGLVLDRAEKGLENVEKDVKEASRIVRFMRRWCCFQVICCCDCFDPDVEMDHKRKKSLQERLKDRQDFSEQQLTSRQAQEAAVHRYAATGDPAFDSNVCLSLFYHQIPCFHPISPSILSTLNENNDRRLLLEQNY